VKLRVYLDTSVFSAYLDVRAPERQRDTREFWERLSEFEAATSEVARQEVMQLPESPLRRSLLGLLATVTVHSVTADMQELAQQYIDASLFTARTANDALHVAAAVLVRANALASWNYRHLVNRRQRAAINNLNASLGLPELEILPPTEL